jgi:hypothetical protein
MAANLTLKDIERFPPEIQKQILDQIKEDEPQPTQTTTQKPPAQPLRRKHKSYLWLYVLLAYIFVIAACILPGLLLKP